jgi:hypothetical protein
MALAGKLFLVELKVATPSGRVKISPHQVAFHVGHKDFPCFVLVAHEAVMYLIEARNVMDLVDKPIKEVRLTGCFSINAEGFETLEHVLEMV